MKWETKFADASENSALKKKGTETERDTSIMHELGAKWFTDKSFGEDTDLKEKLNIFWISFLASSYTRSVIPQSFLE